MSQRRILRRQWWILATASAGLALAGCGSATKSATTSTTTPTTSTTTPTTTATTPPTTTPVPSIAPYLALWPFRTVADVQSWEQNSSPTGTGSWHLSAATTALHFTMGFLGFSEINVVVRTTLDATGAHVAVGFRPTSSVTSTSAIVHLVRWGTGSNAPWEVVGTDDTTFSLTTPAYGATASSPLHVGGTISGVDENIRVTVRQPSSSAPIGSSCCTPAGGTGTPWQATVTFTGATDPVLTAIAATGGHVQSVERFTVTGVHSPHG